MQRLNAQGVPQWTANVVAYRISPSGVFAWGDNGIVLSTGNGNYSPKVIATASGNAIVA
jgi:hypothetical protein